MKTVKIECNCGQHYVFDVEPSNGLMPVAVACPACGADGTSIANAILARDGSAIPSSPPPPVAPPSPVSGPIRLHVAEPITIGHTTPPPLARARAPVPAPVKRGLTWYEHIWVALPIGLVVVGGLIGGACGGAAWAINRQVFLKTQNGLLRYLFTGLISAFAFLVWLLLAAMLFVTLKRNGLTR
jgi:hypothetical protein